MLEELRDTRHARNGGERRLLDEVDTISSLSSGSFTAAYCGLSGERILDAYQDVFLNKNVQKILINGLFNPLNSFRFMSQCSDLADFKVARAVAA